MNKITLELDDQDGVDAIVRQFVERKLGNGTLSFGGKAENNAKLLEQAQNEAAEKMRELHKKELESLKNAPKGNEEFEKIRRARIEYLEGLHGKNE